VAVVGQLVWFLSVDFSDLSLIYVRPVVMARWPSVPASRLHKSRCRPLWSVVLVEDIERVPFGPMRKMPLALARLIVFPVAVAGPIA